jgi:hypothetical protein
MHQHRHIPSEPSLSAEIQSDLVLWHKRIAAGGDNEACRDPLSFRLLVARCIHGLADVRLGTLTILETAAGYLETGRASEALDILNAAAKAYRDRPDATVN